MSDADQQFPASKRRSLAGRASDESDPDWKRWFLEVDRRRKELNRKRLRISRYEKDGVLQEVVRKQSEPLSLKKCLSLLDAGDAPRRGTDLFAVRAAWSACVPAEITGECEVYAFKKGILTILVFSTPLLQEIRQFHKEALVKDLRDHWPAAAAPLVRVNFKPGKR